MEKVWGDNFTVVAPKEFKKAIGKVAPRFDGYQQQDSQEFLTFLLDGLHEDLNRIKEKPVTTNPESDGTIPDVEIATKSWEVFKQRNDSFLVDTLYGQVKNQIVCPKCQTTSIVFDPFTFLQLPLPVDNLREIPFTFVPADNRTLPKTLSVKLSAVEFIRAFKAKVADCVGIKLENLRFYEVFKNKWFQPYRRFNDLESIRGLKENESFFVYEVEPLTAEEEEIVKARQLEMKKEFEEGDMVLAELHDGKYYKGEISNIREVTPELPDKKSKKIYTINLNTKSLDFSGTKYLKKCLEHAPRIDTCIKHLRKSQYYNGWDAFGMPQHLHLPTRNLTNRKVLEMVRQKISLYVLDHEAFTVHYRCSGLAEDNVLLPEDDELFPLHLFALIGALPEIRIVWLNPDGYRDEVETEVHALQRQESSRLNTLSIHECLKKFCETEVLDDMNKVYCRKCKEHHNSLKTTTLWKLPDQLIIHLKRFSYGGDFADKVKTPVVFPLSGLDLSPYVVDREQKDEDYIFDLYGVSNHSGLLAGGHYTAYVRSFTDKKWWELDDSDVSPIKDLSQIISKRAYLLFYRRRRKGESAPIDIPILSIDEEGDDELAGDDQELNLPQAGIANRTTLV